MAELLTSEQFLPHVGKVFRVKDGRHALTLVRVERRTLEEGEQVPREPFNLIFHAPPGDLLVAGLYTLDVEDGPSFELYVMPIHTPAPGRQDYQAAFN
jgi:uncharacterized protein DUF6916